MNITLNRKPTRTHILSPISAGGETGGRGHMEGPFTYYLFVTPRFMIVALPVFGAYLAAAYVLRCGLLLLALLLALPFAVFAAYVAWLVAIQPAG